MDEFQRYRDLIDQTDDNKLSHPFGNHVFHDDSATLLLSATPYQQKAGDEMGDATGLAQLFRFIAGDRVQANQILEMIQSYGKRVEKLSDTELAHLIEQKRKIETKILSHMCRTERMLFEPQDQSTTTTKFLSESMSAVNITENHLREFLALRDHVASSRTLLHMWKSGKSPMSYQKKYELIKQAERSNSQLKNNRLLYSSFENSTHHVKTKYVIKDALLDGSAFNLLWIPPSKPYYPLQGAFSKAAETKKALIFSAWEFVPRMVSAEICEIRRKQLDRFYNPSSNPLKATSPNWCRLLFPSPLLIDALHQSDFLNSSSIDNLHQLAQTRIRVELLRKSVTIQNKDSNSASSWQILASAGLPNDFGLMDLKKIYEGRERVGRHLIPNSDERSLVTSDLDSLWNLSQAHTTTESCISDLAWIAISSPIVCLCRAILNHRHSLGLPLFSECEWKLAIAFGYFHFRNFFNRSAHAASIVASTSKSLSYGERVSQYLVDGNFQAVMDEYVFTLSGANSSASIESYFDAFFQATSPRRGKLSVPTASNRNGQAITADIAGHLGKSDEESDSKDIMRASFNSPFWPFVLSTTAVGQEGLDFHTYCQDIYHWNLPNNPIDFEQREGRITRYRSLAVRKSICSHTDRLGSDIKNLWTHLFSNSYRHSTIHDRYSLGISPNWIFVPEVDAAHAGITRHVLDLPLSNDRARYGRLRDDVYRYRLALGQTDVEDFMRRISKNASVTQDVARHLMLCLFPGANVWESLKAQSHRLLQNHDWVAQLLKDTRGFSANAIAEREKKQFVEGLCIQIESYMKLNVEQEREKAALNVAKLYYLLCPTDHIADHTPVMGLEDDWEVLRKAG